MIKVVSFTGSFSYAGKYGVSAVLSGDVTDKLLNQYGFTYAGTAEQTDFTTLLVRAEKVNDFNTGFQYLCIGGLLCKCRGRSVDGFVRNAFRCRFIVNRVT